MAKMFKITHISGWTQGYAKNQWMTARNDAATRCLGDGFEFQIYGETVDRDTFLDVCTDRAEEWFNNKQKTHKLIRVPNGYIAPLTKDYREIWVRR